MDASNFDNISIEELADLAIFKEWVLHPTSSQQQYWETLLNADPILNKKAQEAKQLVLALEQYYQKELPNRAAPDPKFAKKLSETMLAHKSSTIPLTARISRRKLLRRWSVAAAVALLIGLVNWWASQDLPAKTWVTHKTNFGEWKKLNLPDGSVVHLNANSELRLAKHWTERIDRQVWLSGEAYFEVTKKEKTKAKFQVITDALTVEVLGTLFNVNSRGTNTQVYLEEGKIKLNTPEKSVDLKPNDFIDYTKGATKLTVQKMDSAQKSTAWKEGTLFLSEHSVKAILERLSEIYGFTYQLEDENLLTEIKTVALPMDQLELMLSILEKTFDASIDLEGKELVIRARE